MAVVSAKRQTARFGGPSFVICRAMECGRGRTEQDRRRPPVQHHPKDGRQMDQRFRAEGVDGLRDRSSRPLSLPSQTAPATCAVVEALRRQRYTGSQIAVEVAVSPATVSRILRRGRLNRLAALELAEPVAYEREHPGEIIHIDIKKLGRVEQRSPGARIVVCLFSDIDPSYVSSASQ
jgi:hypothetical protein